MSERRTLHPLYVAFGVLNFIKGFIPLILIALLRGVNWDEVLRWYWIAGASGLLVLIVAMSYLQWRRFGFWLEEDRIVIRSGLLFRGEKTIYYSRIHSVNVEQPLIQRLLGIAQLKIETPGGGQKSDGILHALSVADANRIKQQLREFAKVTISDVDEGKPHDEVTATTDRAAANPSELQSAARPTAERVPTASKVVRTASKTDSVTLDALQLFKAAATSLNFGLALAFIGGLYSFADDFLELLLPDRFFQHLIEDSRSLMPSVLFIVIIAMFVIGLTWVLSIVLFILKFSGFTMGRDGQQVSISYGLLERKSYVFDPKNVQAVIINESLLRQWFGFAEVRLQIVSSDKQEQLMLHPFVAFADIDSLLARFVPGMRVFDPAELSASPPRAMLYYVRVPYIIAVAICAACIGFFGAAGAWSLFLMPVMYAWCRGRHRAAGMLLKDGQLTLRKRFIGRTTYSLRKPRIVMMKVTRTDGQKRKALNSLTVRVLGSGSDYNVDCLKQDDIETAWRWFSRSRPSDGSNVRDIG
ncbi:PH domain-containing protein [Paenibacillus sp. LHD-117]|uniref:PH domain-containing protein n=1 Tax=Paenibacillus sp. LHD-117 TaxID=3071412 RepID=UPI0027DFE5C3|nr:PH domain-containing protein [Paenibacillus sp. LHD-117]MDQ6422840.1 PH domain-containing protein [Paenibacillus sp. LHD-117]